MHFLTLLAAQPPASPDPTNVLPQWVPIAISVLALIVTGYNIWLTGTRSKKQWAQTRLADSVISYWEGIRRVNAVGALAYQENIDMQERANNIEWAQRILNEYVSPDPQNSYRNIPEAYEALNAALQPLQYLVQDKDLRQQLGNQAQWAQKYSYVWQYLKLEAVDALSSAENTPISQRFIYQVEVLIRNTYMTPSLLFFQDLGEVIWETHLPTPLKSNKPIPALQDQKLIPLEVENLI
ncbi:hypothetical protein ACFYE2_08005 [Kocuria sp. CPCC 205300]|uniref:hypothetical protein n=1 Tax=Kocuria sabuli TaxID=3071448 RepID=UPI0036DE2321